MHYKYISSSRGHISTYSKDDFPNNEKGTSIFL